MPKDKTGRAAQRQHRIGTYRSAHPHAPDGGRSSLLPIDYEHEDVDVCALIDLLPRPSQEAITMAKQKGATRQDRIERRSLRAYHPRVAEVVMQIVNEGFATVRLQPNSLMLYPLDGSHPTTVNARKDDREWKIFQKWALAHVVGQDHPLGVTEDQMIRKLSEQDAARELAAKHNDPVEHPKPEPPPERKPHSEPKVESPPPPEPEPEPEWRPYTGKTGDLPEGRWETNGTYIRCVPCLNDGLDFHTTEPTSLGGHWRMNHNRVGLDTEEARAKSTETRRFNRLSDQVQEAVTILASAIGQQVGAENATYIEELEADNTRLSQESAAQRRLIADLTRERDECQARLNLLREAMGA